MVADRIATQEWLEGEGAEGLPELQKRKRANGKIDAMSALLWMSCVWLVVA